MEKNLKMNTYMYTHTQIYLNNFAVHLKLTHYKSTTLQFLKERAISLT